MASQEEELAASEVSAEIRIIGNQVMKDEDELRIDVLPN